MRPNCEFLRGLAWLVVSAAVLCGCDSPARPSVLGLTLTMPSSVSGRFVPCATCDGPWVVAEFPITVGDPDGPGGTIEEVKTAAVNRSRDLTLSSNTRPNADFAYPARALAAGGRLELTAGVIIAPAPPPRDEIVVTVLVRLIDGRATTASAPLVVGGVQRQRMSTPAPSARALTEARAAPRRWRW